MRLVAIYIVEHEYLYDKPQVINLGGKYIYEFEKINENHINLSRKENLDFIEGFWGNEISIVSTVVGANATGKTTLLKIINKGFKEFTKTLFIYESLNSNEVCYLNRVGDYNEDGYIMPETKVRITSADFTLSENDNTSTLELYYSSIFDEKVYDFYSPLHLNSSNIEDNLSTIFQNNILKENLFLNSKISDIIKSVYADFPAYNSNVISAKALYKSDIKKVYLDSNIGFTNVLKYFRTDIKWEIEKNKERLKNEREFYKDEDLERRILYLTYLLKITEKDVLIKMFEVILSSVFTDEKIEDQLRFFFRKDSSLKVKITDEITLNEIDYQDLSVEEKKDIFNHLKFLKQLSMVDMLEHIWDDYPSVNDSQSHLIHSSNDLLENLEVNILSFLVLKDVYAINGLQGGYDSAKIIEEKDFKIRVNNFLRKFLVQKHKLIYEKIIRELGDNFDVIKEKDLIIGIIEADKFSKEIGIETMPIKKRMIQDIKSFSCILEFYDFIKSMTERKEGSLNMNVKDEKSVENLKIFFNLYNQIKEYFLELPLRDRDLISIQSDNKLSYGEKMLLNLYSVFFDFSMKKGHNTEYENYLILLDEADLGYHPLWKRKYICAIIKTLPIIFENFQPQSYNKEIKKKHKSVKKKPTLQIIFTTHDPLTLSDIPNSNVIYLKKELQKTIVVNKIVEPKKSFGANITDLLADSFFYGNEDKALIGEFAKHKIQESIDWLNEDKPNLQKRGYFKKLIEIIDEPLIKYKLRQKYYEKFPDQIDNEIEIKEFKEKAIKLGYKIEKKNL